MTHLSNGNWRLGLVTMTHGGNDCAGECRSEAYGMIQNRIGRPLTMEEDEERPKRVTG